MGGFSGSISLIKRNNEHGNCIGQLLQYSIPVRGLRRLFMALPARFHCLPGVSYLPYLDCQNALLGRLDLGALILLNLKKWHFWIPCGTLAFWNLEKWHLWISCGTLDFWNLKKWYLGILKIRKLRFLDLLASGWLEFMKNHRIGTKWTRDHR